MEDQMNQTRYIKYEEYQGHLPRPRKLSNSFAIAGHPKSLTDGYAVDLYVTDGSTNNESKTLKTTVDLDSILVKASNGGVLSEPKYVADLLAYQVFILLTANRKPIAVQTRYYNYFYFRYKGCQFRGKYTMEPVIVMHEGRIVGAIMPVLVDMPPLEDKS